MKRFTPHIMSFAVILLSCSAVTSYAATDALAPQVLTSKQQAIPKSQSVLGTIGTVQNKTFTLEVKSRQLKKTMVFTVTSNPSTHYTNDGKRGTFALVTTGKKALITGIFDFLNNSISAQKIDIMAKITPTKSEVPSGQTKQLYGTVFIDKN